MLQAKLSEKGQLQFTVPKDERDRLGLRPGDMVALVVKPGTDEIDFQKLVTTTMCRLCNGSGNFYNEGTCFICENGQLPLHYTIWDILTSSRVRMQKVIINVTTQFVEIPKIELKSNTFSEEAMTYAQEVLQLMLIEQFAERSVTDPIKFLTPSDVVLNEIISLLHTPWGKERVRSMFRHGSI
ncbi:AbrB/MazE/SpoVT family DNA-binding domain-containing protein [Paenibacillus periandrae]|uniref:AbrB/MazE/SpoVT family DNA-binding domain-containing protein n=1 Tax=Paenibacillus periandrae TaxID=1761741 RepID=UPI001F098654|nr:AbrB/MazE/SpoVT family DNA-binding domain-containing protein [Paenibacillus periandrae]